METGEGFEAHCNYYRAAFQIGLCDVNDIVRWADARIAAAETPSHELIELALLEKFSKKDVLGILIRVGGNVATDATLRWIVGCMYEQLVRQPECAESFAKGLSQLSLERGYCLPWDLFGLMAFETEFDLAKYGGFGKVEDVLASMIDFAKPFALTMHDKSDGSP